MADSTEIGIPSFLVAVYMFGQLKKCERRHTVKSACWIKPTVYLIADDTAERGLYILTMKRQNGLPLIELLLAVAVLGVVLTTGVPAYQEFIKNNRVTGQAGELIIALQLTRSEAVKRGSGTVICTSTDQRTCSGGTNWASGWITFSDLDQDGALDGNGTCTTNTDHLTRECILRVNDGLNDAVLTGGDNHVHFLPSGLALNGPVSFTLKADDCTYQQQRNITVTRQGRTSSTKQNCT